MTNDEIIEYLSTYIKACKIRGNPFIMVYMGVLYLVSEWTDALYAITLNHLQETVIATTYKNMVDKGFIGVDFSVYNLIGKFVKTYTSYPFSNYIPINRDNNAPYDIPSRASDNAKLTKYYYDTDPTKNVLVPEFYGMVPIAKADSYEMYCLHPSTVRESMYTILLYKVHKKKPNIDINIYRRIINL